MQFFRNTFIFDRKILILISALSSLSNYSSIIEIETNPDFGAWRQLVTLVADDASRPEPQHGSIATGKSHTLNSEELANLVPSAYRKEKIYI